MMDVDSGMSDMPGIEAGGTIEVSRRAWYLKLDAVAPDL
jgi:hypothetical protein